MSWLAAGFDEIDGGEKSMSAFWLTLGVVFCLVGVLGLIAPALPGLPLIFVGVWLMALSDDYQVIGPGSLIVFFVLCSVGVALDYVAGMMGAKFSGASKKAYWGALAGGIVGVFMGLPGIFLGSAIGAMVGEILSYSGALAVGKVGMATFVGFLAGVALKIGVAIVIFVWVAVLWGAHWAL